MKRNNQKQQVKKISKVSQGLILTKQEILKRELQDVENNISRKIESNVLGIPKTIIPYFSQKNKNEQSQLTCSRLFQERRKLEDRLKELEMAEKEFTEKSRVRTSMSMEASRYTKQEKQQIKKFKKKLIDFEKSLEQKNRFIQNERIRLANEEDVKDRRQKDEINEIKKIKIEQRLKELKQRMIEREIVKRETDGNVRKVERGQKKYYKMNEQWKDRNMNEEQKKYEIMELRMKEKHVDFSGLKQHQKRYQQVLQAKKKQLEEKRLSVSRMILTENRSMSVLKTRYHYILEEEERQAKQEEEERKQKQKFLIEKQVQYSEYVRDEFIPKKKQGEESTLLHRSNSQKIEMIRKTDQQIKNIGNQNLILGNKKIKKKTSQNLGMDDDKNKSNIRLPLYHDYLKEIHKQRSQTKENSPNKIQIMNPKKEVFKIMNDNCLKSQQKVDMIKLLANRIDQKGSDLVENIQNKLSILSAL